MYGNAQDFLCVLRQVLLYQFGREPVKACVDGRMGRKDVPGTRNRERITEGLARLFHILASSLQHGESGVTFIQVANVRVHSKLP